VLGLVDAAGLRGQWVAGDGVSAGEATHFEHQDWLGTERMRTTYNGGVEGSYTSLPFGDGYAPSGTDTDANHYAQLDQDAESGTAHALNRQDSTAQGRWLSPDPYGGSYDISNPQSMNRYAYASNSPLANTDPSGLVTPSHSIYGFSFGGGGCIVCIEQAFQAYNAGMTQANSGYFGNYNSEFQDLDTPETGTHYTYVTHCMLDDSDENCIPGTMGGTWKVYPGEESGANVNFMMTMQTGPNNGNNCSVLDPNSNCTLSKLKTLWDKNWDCVANVGWPVLSADLNPFSFGIGTAADAADQMSQTNMQFAAAWSMQRGLTVPLRSSIVRASVGASELLGRASYILTGISVIYAEGHAIIAEHEGCTF